MRHYQVTLHGSQQEALQVVCTAKNARQAAARALGTARQLERGQPGTRWRVSKVERWDRS